MPFSERNLYVTLGAVTLLCLMVFLAPPILRYDEPFHLSAARALRHAPDVRTWLRSPTWSAAGPLYAVVYSSTANLTEFEPGPMRLVNLLFTGITLLTLLLASWRLGTSDACRVTAILFTIPMFWPIAGLAMTEMPALAAASCAMLALLWKAHHWVPNEASAVVRSTSALLFTSLVQGVLVGDLFALAFLGRQGFLVMVIPLVWLAVTHKRLRLTSLVAALMLASVAATLIMTWGGLTAKSVAGNVRGVISVEHGMLAFAYLGFMILIIEPTFLQARRSVLLLALLLGIAMQFTPARLDHVPMQRSLLPILGKTVITMLQYGSGAMLAALAMWTGLSLLLQILVARTQPVRQFLLLSVLLLTGVIAAVTLKFSSRYVTMAIPFLALVLADWSRTNPSAKLTSDDSSQPLLSDDQGSTKRAESDIRVWLRVNRFVPELVRWSVGMLIGIVSLYRYLY